MHDKANGDNLENASREHVRQVAAGVAEVAHPPLKNVPAWLWGLIPEYMEQLGVLKGC